MAKQHKNGSAPRGSHSETLQSAKAAVRSKADFAKELFDHLTSRGLDETAAWQRAGQLLDPDYPTSPIARISESEYDAGGKEPAMAVAVKTKKISTKHPVARFLAGSWAMRIARGLKKWREAKGLNVTEAAEKIGFDRMAWYRIENGLHPGTTGKNIDQICEAIRVSFDDLLKMGDEE